MPFLRVIKSEQILFTKNLSQKSANTAAVFMEASNNLPQAQMLAVQYTGVTFASLASTAGYIAETIMEELPRLPSFKAYLPETTQSL